MTQATIRIWGRANSGNVKKVLVVAEELGVPYERIDAGLQFGVVDTPEFRRLNPNGRVPTMEDGDYVLWESHAICRYLAMTRGGEAIYPADPKLRAGVDRWLDWLLGTAIPVESPLYRVTVRMPPETHDKAKIAETAAEVAGIYQILEDRLDGRPYLEGASVTLADLLIGIFVYRFVYNPFLERANQPRLAEWLERLRVRPSYQKWVDETLT